MKREVLMLLVVFLVVLALGVIELTIRFGSDSPTEHEHRYEKPVIIHPQAVERTYGSVTITSIVHVHDGDTFTVNIGNWPGIVGDKISVRVRGVDAPEMADHRPEVKTLAIRARDYTSDLLHKGKVIELKGLKRDKYFRINAEVYIDGNGLGDALLAAGLAHPYDGGKKRPWTIDEARKWLKTRQVVYGPFKCI